MEQWEYLPTYIEANARDKDTRQYLKENIGTNRPPRYMVEALMPELNKLGADGWELVHMEPVPRVGRRGNVLLGARQQWSNVYFCVFKRRKPGTVQPVLPVDSDGNPAHKPDNDPDPMPLAPKPPESPQLRQPKSNTPQDQLPEQAS